jgi:predicted dinucleotide-binding enzyme
MQISSTFSVSSITASVTTSDLVSLQKEIKELAKKLKDLVANTSMGATAKRQETQLLQVQIGAVHALISAMQDQHRQAFINRTNPVTPNGNQQERVAKKAKDSITLSQVDTFA